MGTLMDTDPFNVVFGLGAIAAIAAPGALQGFSR